MRHINSTARAVYDFDFYNQVVSDVVAAVVVVAVNEASLR